MTVRVWDLFVRCFHWSLVLLFAANLFVIDNDSDLHQWVGYAIVALIVLRILWGFIGTQYARFSSFPPDAQASLEQAVEMLSGKEPSVHKGHTPLGALMIYNIILCMLGIGLSGYFMTSDAFWGKEWPEVLHESLVAWAQISVVLHILAVFFESFRTKVNLPWSMITGNKTFKE